MFARLKKQENINTSKSLIIAKQKVKSFNASLLLLDGWTSFRKKIRFHLYDREGYLYSS